MRRSNADRAWPIALAGVLVLVLSLIGVGLDARWTLALPVTGLLRFLAWVLRGIYISVPILAAGTAIVRLTMRCAPKLPPVMALALRWAMGSAAVIAIGLVMLAAGWYTPMIWQLLALAGWAGVLVWLVARRWQPVLDAWKHVKEHRPAMPALVSWESLLLSLGAISTLAAFLPPDTRDELAYHLVLPKLWAFQGNWWVPPANFTLLFPANTEILWSWSMATGGLLAARFLTLVFATLTVALLWEWLDTQPGGRWSRNLALVLLLAAPVALTSASICYVEWPLMFFLLLGWGLSRFDVLSRANGLLWAPALMWGVSAGMKYTAILFAGLLGLEWLAGLWRRNRREALTALIALAVSASVFGGPWLVRNVLATGDPVVPLGSAIGLGQSPSGNAAHLADYVQLTGLWRWMPAVYHATADSVVDNRLHPVWPLLFLAVMVLGWRWRRELPWVTVTASFVLLVPFSPSPRVELPLLVLATLFIPALLAPALRSRMARALAVGITVIIAVVSIPLSVYFLLAAGGPATPRYLLGLTGPQRYLSERGVLTPAMKWVAEQTPADARIWVWCDDRVLYFDRWVRPDGPFQPPVFLSDLRRGGAAALTRAVEDVGFIAIRRDHCPANWATARVEAIRWKMTAADRQILHAWMHRHLRLVFQGPRYTIYARVAQQGG